MRKILPFLLSCFLLIPAVLYAQQKVVQQKPTLNSTNQLQQFKQVPKSPASRSISTARILNPPGSHASKTQRKISKFQPKPLSFYKTQNRLGNSAEIRYSKDGIPIFIKQRSQSNHRAASMTDAELMDACHIELSRIKPIIPVDDPTQEFEMTSLRRDELGMAHIRFQQKYKDIPIHAAEAILHFGAGGEVIFNGRYSASPKLPTVVPGISEELAIENVLADLEPKTIVRELTAAEQEVLNYDAPRVKLVIYQNQAYFQQQRLAYHIEIFPNFVYRFDYMVDAQTGEILRALNTTCSLHNHGSFLQDNEINAQGLNGQTFTINTFGNNTDGYLLVDISKPMFTGNPLNPDNGDGIIITADLQGTNLRDPSFALIESNNNSDWNRNAVSAHFNASFSYDYFENTFGWRSINGQGGDITSFINVADEDGNDMDNAFWNGEAMFYGNGDRAFSDLAGSLDVGGHEMGHGVIQATANLEYQGESGALNESYADIFGASIDDDDWLIGEDITSTQFFPTGALRDMENPNNGGNSLNDNGYQPKNVSEQFFGREDNGGVHINSGINNRAFVEVAKAIGRNEAEQIYFRALREYLTRSSQFVDMRLAAVQAAQDRNNPASVINAINAAYDLVQIIDNTGGSGTETEIELTPIEGNEFIISSDTDPTSPEELFIFDVAGNTFRPAISNTAHKRPISVTDDGSRGVFVGKDNLIYLISTDPTQQPNQTPLNFNPPIDWDNAAISKDGNRLAAITTEVDTSIWVCDLVSGNCGIYTLFNPTTAEGVSTGDVLFADAIEWDFSGEVILYDAFNRINSGSGNVEDVTYWDVGLIRAWDTDANDFGDGNIIKLFTNLPEGISVGNARFAKNAPFVITYDMFGENDPSTANDDVTLVMAANLERNDIDTVFQNALLGFPSYSVDDSKIIFTALNNDQDTILATVDMASNRISPVPGTATGFLPDSKWPVWYVVGERVSTNIEPALAAKIGLKLLPNPNQGKFQLSYELQSQMELSIDLYNLQGQLVRELIPMGPKIKGNHVENLEISDVNPGTYMLKLTANGANQFLKVVKH